MLLMKQTCRLLGGEGSDVEGSSGGRRKELAVHLVGYDAHVEAQIDFDAGMEEEF